MAFLCPSRKSRQKKKKKEEEEPYMGRITGSSSIDTLVRVGLEKQHGLTTESRMMVLDDFQACAADEVGVERGQVVFMLYTEHEWMYILRDDGLEGFIPRSFVKPCRSPALMKRKPPTPLSQIRGGSEDDDGNDGDESNSPTNSSSQAAGFTEATSPDPEDGEVVVQPASPASEDDGRRDSVQSQPGGEEDGEAPDDEELPDILPFGKRDQGKWVALTAYDVVQENDVRVTSGEVLTLLNSDDKDWYWVRRSSGAEGFVPRVFLCKLPDDFRINNIKHPAPIVPGRGVAAHRAVAPLKPRASNGYHRSLSLTDHHDQPAQLSLPAYLKPPLRPTPALGARNPASLPSNHHGNNPAFRSSFSPTTTTTTTSSAAATSSSTSCSGSYNVPRAELMHNAAVRAAAVLHHGAAAGRRGSSSGGGGGGGGGGGSTAPELSSALAGRPPRPHSSLGYSHTSSSSSQWTGFSDPTSTAAAAATAAAPVSPTSPGVSLEGPFASGYHHQGAGLPPHSGWSQQQRHHQTSGTVRPTSDQVLGQGQEGAANVPVSGLPPPYTPPPLAHVVRERPHSSLGNLTHHARRGSAESQSLHHARAPSGAESAGSRTANSGVLVQRPHSVVGFATAEFASGVWEGTSGGLRKPISLPASAGHIPPASSVAGRSRPGSPTTDDSGGARLAAAPAVSNSHVIDNFALPSSPTSPGVAGPSAHRHPLSQSGFSVPPKTPPPSSQDHAHSPPYTWPSSPPQMANNYTPHPAPHPSSHLPNHGAPPPPYPSNHHVSPQHSPSHAPPSSSNPSNHHLSGRPQSPSHAPLPPPYPANHGALPPPYPSNHHVSPQHSPSYAPPSSNSHSPTSPQPHSAPLASHKNAPFATASNRFATSAPPRQTMPNNSHLAGAGLSASLNQSYTGRRPTLAHQNSAPSEIPSSSHSAQHPEDIVSSGQQNRLLQQSYPHQQTDSVVEAAKSRRPPALGNTGRSASVGREFNVAAAPTPQPPHGGEGVVTELMTLHKFSGRGADDISVASEEIVYCDVSKQPERDWLWVFSPRLQKHGFVPRDNVTVPRSHANDSRGPCVARV